MCGEIEAVDRPDRGPGDDREGEARETLRDSLKYANLIGPARPAAAQHQSQV
jgi:hypothetical protein